MEVQMRKIEKIMVGIVVLMVLVVVKQYYIS